MADTASPTSPGTPPKGPRHWPTWLALGVMWLAARLPWPVQRALGAGIGALAFAVAGERRRAARANLALCLPAMPEPARETLLREINFGEDVEIDPSCGLCIGFWNGGGECGRRRHPDCDRHRL